MNAPHTPLAGQPCLPRLKTLACLGATALALALPGVSRADVNRDGKPDLLWQNYGSGQIGAWLLDHAAVTGTPTLSWTCGAGSGCAALWRPIGAFGDSRLLWHNATSGEVSAWLLNGTAVTGTRTLAAKCDNASGCAKTWSIVGTGAFHSGDYWGGDLLWHNPTSGQLGVWFVDGTKVEPQNINLKCGEADGCSYNWKVVGVSRHGGAPNILWHNQTTGDLGWWYLTDTTSLHPTPPTQLRSPYYTTVARVSAPLGWKCGATGGCAKTWQVIGVDDVDYDGKDDVLWFNRQTGEVSAWLMNGLTVKGTLTLAAKCDAASSCSTTWYPMGLMTGSPPIVR